jgi:aspartyl-tRNA(Asn)/glutamyl-tRNA(Gln) amidotransferase subunit A
MSTVDANRDGLWTRTATELGELYRSGAATPAAVLVAVLERLEAVNPAINAVITLDLAGARAAAEASALRWRNGTPLGPLDGVPLTIKDNLFVGGLRATWGSLLYADHVAPQDDLPVARLRAAGAIIVGKTNTPELALAGYTDNRVFGPSGNPWASHLTPGGSSGGAVAAVAAGIGPLAIATDAGGSIRRPAGHTGVAGIKPGTGRVPRRYGFPPLAQDLQVIGAIARSIADLQLAFAAIATPPERSDACDVLRAAGHTVEIIAVPWDRDEVDVLFGGLTGPGVARVVANFPDWESKVTDGIARQAAAGIDRRAADYVVTLDRLARFRWAMQDVMAAWDVLATPSAACLPWPRSEPYPPTINGQTAGPRSGAIFSTAVNLAGLPAIVVPSPVTPGCLPCGLQLIGPMQSEERLLGLAAHFESAQPWPQLAPI